MSAAAAIQTSAHGVCYVSQHEDTGVRHVAGVAHPSPTLRSFSDRGSPAHDHKTETNRAEHRAAAPSGHGIHGALRDLE